MYYKHWKGYNTALLRMAEPVTHCTLSCSDGTSHPLFQRHYGSFWLKGQSEELVLILERPSRSHILAQPKQISTCVFITQKKAPKTSKVKNDSLIPKHVKSTKLISRALTITMQAITTGKAYFLECIHDFMYIYLYHI